MTEKIKTEWWYYDTDFQLTELAPEWLKQEMDSYNLAYKKWQRKGENCICYDVPFTLAHPIMDRLTDEQFKAFELEYNIKQ